MRFSTLGSTAIFGLFFAAINRVQASSSKETWHTRDYFYVGGEYVNTTIPGGHLFHNQMYVEKLSPKITLHPYPIVFVHGGAQTGTVSHMSLHVT
jgi:hypothetical protein